MGICAHENLGLSSVKMNYREFLQTKVEIAKDSGFEIDKSELNDALMPHQKDAVQWALRGGKRALFESYGLGKTVQELEFCYQAIRKHGGKAMIVCPLGVKQEFTRDAERILGYKPPRYVRTMKEITAVEGSEIVLTNYERVRDGDIDPAYFTATSLDEASVLRSYGSKTYQTFLPKFKQVPYKMVATATPSPNKYKELIHYAGYLDVMDTGQALTRFFQRDSTKANNLTLYPSMEDEFWVWISSWSLFITKPSDLNPDYSDDGYNLPPLQVNWHELPIEYGKVEEKNGQMRLFEDAAAGLTESARVKRESIDARVAKAKEIVDANPDEHFILWHDLESERHAIKKALPESREIFGNQDIDIREKNTIDFSDGKFRLLATKQSLSGSGCNFQRFCHREIFVGVDYKANDFMQAIHRCYRFLQDQPVIIDIIYMESEKEVKNALLKKWQNHDKMVARMVEIVKKYGLNDTNKFKKLERKMGCEIKEVEGEYYKIANADCVDYTRTLEDNSVGMILTSIPFSNHYEYTPSYNDFGHNRNTTEFFEQMDYLTPELLRVLKPGRVAAIHVKDRVMFGNVTGYGMPSMEPFHMMTTQHFMKHGFIYFGMITITTDVVRENNQTYRLGYTEMCKDGTKMGVGCPEYLLLFRKLPSDTSKGFADDRVPKEKDAYSLGQWQLDAHAYWRTDGDRLLNPDELIQIQMSERMKIFKEFCQNHIYNYKAHVKLSEDMERIGLERGGREGISKEFMTFPPASNNEEVWDDISRMKTLNTTQSRRRAQLHVCPLQIDIVERSINRWSKEKDVIFDPFLGVGTVAKCAIEMGRYGIGSELNEGYFNDAVGYVQAAEREINSPTLFDIIGV